MLRTVQFPEDADFDSVIFDCDGTLVDSMPLHFRAWRIALEASGATFEFDWRLFTSRAGMGLRETVVALNSQFSHVLDPEEVVRAQRAAFEELLPELGVVLPVVEFARAQFQRVPLSVASGGEKRIVLRELAQTGIDHLFQTVICNEDVSKGKPDPEMFLECARSAGVPPSRCLVVEDGDIGVEAAMVAGMQCLRV